MATYVWQFTKENFQKGVPWYVRKANCFTFNLVSPVSGVFTKDDKKIVFEEGDYIIVTNNYQGHVVKKRLYELLERNKTVE